MPVPAARLQLNYVAVRVKASSPLSGHAFPRVDAVVDVNQRYRRSILRSRPFALGDRDAVVAAIIATTLNVWLLIHFLS